MKKSIIIFVALAVIVIGYGAFTYSKISSASKSVDAEWVRVEAQYGRRFSLIQNVVDMVKDSMKKDGSVFSAFADARSGYSVAKNTDEKAVSVGDIESSYAQLLVIIDNYPEIKSSRAFQALVSQIDGTENGISVERGLFNDYVRSYNMAIGGFPGSVLAKIFGFDVKAYFQSAGGTEDSTFAY